MSRSFLFFRWMHGIFVVAAILDLFLCSTQRQQTRPSVVSVFFWLRGSGQGNENKDWDRLVSSATSLESWR